MLRSGLRRGHLRHATMAKSAHIRDDARALRDMFVAMLADMHDDLELAGYAELLSDLKARIGTARVRAALAMNRELVELYWHIGREILARQDAQGWGGKVIERLSRDLRSAFPDMRGLSRTNPLYMRAFAQA
jgi:predicted nuclease of restriction endonuclease-like (RecB) superfamily